MSTPPVQSSLVRAVSVSLLRCAACGELAPQKQVWLDSIDVQTVPGRPFARAVAWAEGVDAPEESPLWHGLCLCPECRYAALPGDFGMRAPVAAGGPARDSQMLRRLFVDQRFGVNGGLAPVLGAEPELTPPPARALRVTLAAIATLQMLPPTPGRIRSLARLHSRLTWLFLDTTHLVWQTGPRRHLIGWTDRARGIEVWSECLARLEASRGLWPDLPLEEVSVRIRAVGAQSELCRQSAANDPASVHAEELRRLALLLGLNGERERAAAAYREAIELCWTGGAQAYERYREARETGAESYELRRHREEAQRCEEQRNEYEREAALAVALEPQGPARWKLPAWVGPEPEDPPRLLGLFG